MKRSANINPAIRQNALELQSETLIDALTGERMAYIENPYNLDDDDDAVFSGLLCQGLIWVEDNDESDHLGERLEPKFKYLESSGQTKIRVLQGHEGRVNTIEVQGEYVFSGSNDRTIRIWNWSTGEEKQTLRGHHHNVRSLAVSGDFVISASDDKTVRVWNWVTGNHVRTLEGYSHQVSNVAVDGNVVASASRNEIWLWNWQSGELLEKLVGTHSDVVYAISVDGDLVFSASRDVVVVRDWRSRQVLHVLEDAGSLAREYQFGLNGDFLICVDEDIYVWAWKTGDELSAFDSLQDGNGQISTKHFILGSQIVFWGAKTRQWYSYWIDSAYDKAMLVPGYAYIITSDHGGWLYVLRTNSSLRRAVASHQRVAERAPSRITETSVIEEQSGHRAEAGAKRETRTSHSLSYSVDDVVLAAREYVSGRDEEWVNFSQVMQYLHERFTKLDPKQLGELGKHYGSLLKVFADYPNVFELRRDSAKQGLYWIRLVHKRAR